MRFQPKVESTSFGKVIYYGDDKTLRFALYYYSDDLEDLYLSNVFVNPKFRQKGYGDKILDFAFKFAKQHNFSQLFLNVSKNSWVKQWYQSRGFIPIEDCGKDYPGNIWMKANV